MINSQNLIDKICAKIACGGLTDLETCQTTGALNILSNPVISVASFVNLPNANEYAGRLIYVDDENRYYHAVGGYWLSNLCSKVFNYADDVWAWGCNESGRLGDGTTTNRCSPVSVIDSFTDWCQVSAGDSHSLGVRTDGTAWAWGCNGSGQLGDGTTVSKSSPVSVIGGFTDWCQVSSGSEHSLGVRTDGTAWGWGNNLRGILGNNSSAYTSSPVSVVGGFTDWCQLEAGGGFSSFGIRQNGTLLSWGTGGSGRLGDGTTVDKSSPVSVIGGFTDWCQVSSSGAHSLGVRCNGTAWAWGSNGSGLLGDGTTVTKSSPVSVIGGFTDWCQVSSGSSHSLGVRSDGTAWAWGTGTSGQLGDGTIVTKSSPVSVVGGFTDWCQVSAGFCHSLGVRINGTVWAWGGNIFGVLGDGTTVNKSSPVSVIGGFTDWCQASAGLSHTLALRQRCKGF
jgi:alpha-tubulin suppressor-like RCC1 family protein